MDRKNFLNNMGVNAETFALINCIGCKKSDGGSSSHTTGPAGLNFSLDLSLTANVALLTNGGFLVSNGIVVTRINIGGYIAVQRACAHESYILTYQSTNNRFYCHGATFSENRTVTNRPASRSLSVYNIQLKELL
jgi:cytochrome b6-f complex iron-sulfur subunit